MFLGRLRVGLPVRSTTSARGGEGLDRVLGGRPTAEPGAPRSPAGRTIGPAERARSGVARPGPAHGDRALPRMPPAAAPLSRSTAIAAPARGASTIDRRAVPACPPASHRRTSHGVSVQRNAELARATASRSRAAGEAEQHEHARTGGRDTCLAGRRERPQVDRQDEQQRGVRVDGPGHQRDEAWPRRAPRAAAAGVCSPARRVRSRVSGRSSSAASTTTATVQPIAAQRSPSSGAADGRGGGAVAAPRPVAPGRGRTARRARTGSRRRRRAPSAARAARAGAAHARPRRRSAAAPGAAARARAAAPPSRAAPSAPPTGRATARRRPARPVSSALRRAARSARTRPGGRRTPVRPRPAGLAARRQAHRRQPGLVHDALPRRRPRPREPRELRARRTGRRRRPAPPVAARPPRCAAGASGRGPGRWTSGDTSSRSEIGTARSPSSSTASTGRPMMRARSRIPPCPPVSPLTEAKVTLRDGPRRRDHARQLDHPRGPRELGGGAATRRVPRGDDHELRARRAPGLLREHRDEVPVAVRCRRARDRGATTRTPGSADRSSLATRPRARCRRGSPPGARGRSGRGRRAAATRAPVERVRRPARCAAAAGGSRARTRPRSARGGPAAAPPGRCADPASAS